MLRRENKGAMSTQRHLHLQHWESKLQPLCFLLIKLHRKTLVLKSSVNLQFLCIETRHPKLPGFFCIQTTAFAELSLSCYPMQQVQTMHFAGWLQHCTHLTARREPSSRQVCHLHHRHSTDVPNDVVKRWMSGKIIKQSIFHSSEINHMHDAACSVSCILQKKPNHSPTKRLYLSY